MERAASTAPGATAGNADSAIGTAEYFRPRFPHSARFTPPTSPLPPLPHSPHRHPPHPSLRGSPTPRSPLRPRRRPVFRGGTKRAACTGAGGTRRGGTAWTNRAGPLAAFRSPAARLHIFAQDRPPTREGAPGGGTKTNGARRDDARPHRRLTARPLPQRKPRSHWPVDGLAEPMRRAPCGSCRFGNQDWLGRDCNHVGAGQRRRDAL